MHKLEKKLFTLSHKKKLIYKNIGLKNFTNTNIYNNEVKLLNYF